jgi:hypothetical protein
VFDSHQAWGHPDRGLQVFGSAREVGRMGFENVHSIYRARSPDVGSDVLSQHRFYVLRPRRVKLFDEHRLGAGVFVTARVKSGGELAWQTTEVYDA